MSLTQRELDSEPVEVTGELEGCAARGPRKHDDSSVRPQLTAGPERERSRVGKRDLRRDCRASERKFDENLLELECNDEYSGALRPSHAVARTILGMVRLELSRGRCRAAGASTEASSKGISIILGPGSGNHAQALDVGVDE
jgi:hypothetical protein